MSDKEGYKRGARGFAKLDKTDREFLKPSFDRVRQLGEIYVGFYNQVTDNALLEGDDA